MEYEGTVEAFTEVELCLKGCQLQWVWGGAEAVKATLADERRNLRIGN